MSPRRLVDGQDDDEPEVELDSVASTEDDGQVSSVIFETKSLCGLWN